MEGSKEDSGWERSSTSRPLNTTLTIPASTTASLNLARDEEVDEECTQEGSFKGGIGKKLVPFSANESGDVSLREWLDKPDRVVDQLECLHIFRQVVEAVSVAHSQSVVVTNIRPSCFVTTAFNRVSFIESASCSSSGSEDLHDEPGSGEREGEGRELNKSGGCDGGVNEVGERKNFPLKEILVMEFNWYASPEEAEGGSSIFASDIYRLGVLLFELFCVFDSFEEKLRNMSNLRHRVLPPQLLLKWPKVASFCLWLLHPQPESRPKISEVLQSEFFNETRDSLEEREAAIKLREEIEDQELLLDFLLQLQERKEETADKLQDTVSFLSDDIGIVNQKLKGCSFSEPNKDEFLIVESENQPSQCPATNEDSACASSRKRLKMGHWNSVEELNENHAAGPGSEAHSIQEKILSKSSRMMKNFKKLEAAYFSSRSRQMKSAGRLINRKVPIVISGRGSTAKTEGSAVGDLALKEDDNGGVNGWIDPFLEGLCRYLSFSKLKVRADLKQGDLLSSSNLICCLAFDRDKDFFATAGVNKKIKIFECDMLLDNVRDIHYPVVEMASRSKLSSVCWNSYIKSQIASSDFEGVVQVWDVARSEVVVEMKEHERRVWSVDFSLADPTKLASGSDDGTVKLWNINQGGSIGSIRTKANVCSVQFAPDSSQLLAIGSADHNIYCYDLRNLRIPYCTMFGHTKTVSYVKFMDSTTLVSASTDNSLKLWDLSSTTSRALENPLQTFTGHTNIKNFVGLSISDGYIATGSETNEDWYRNRLDVTFTAVLGQSLYCACPENYQLSDMPEKRLEMNRIELRCKKNKELCCAMSGANPSDGAAGPLMARDVIGYKVFVYHKAFQMPVLSYKFNSSDSISGREADDGTQFISCVCWRGQSSTLVAANSSGNIKILEMV